MRLLSSLAILALGFTGPSSGAFVTEPNPDITYDYVIVGSGAGGGTLASRLAIYGHKVLLIDAGADHGDEDMYRIPAFSLRASDWDAISWDYFVNHWSDLDRQKKDSKMTWTTADGKSYIGTNPPPGAKPKGVWYPRAGTLGGCTAHNAMISIYPPDSDWDAIAKLTGDSSWSPDKMRRLFMRLESNQCFPSSVVGHGYGGWLSTSITNLGFTLEDTKILSQIMGAGAALGTPVTRVINSAVDLGRVLIEDLNSAFGWRETREGMYQTPLSINNGYRSGTRDFIMETMATQRMMDGKSRYHLDVLLNTLVTKVDFEKGKDGRPTARGVSYLQGENLYSAHPHSNPGQRGVPGSVKAAKEVILSAGTFNTPQLLKLSGVGPRDELESFGIDVLVDLPGVGTNMQDRYETTMIAEADQDFIIAKKCTWMESFPDPCYDKWKRGGSDTYSRGGYTSNGIPLSIMKRSTAVDGDVPDLLISGAPAAFRGYYQGYSRDATAENNHWSWIVLKAHTRNTAGTVRLRSTDPRDTPEINFNYFDSGTTDGGAHEKDMQAMIDGMMFARQAIASTPVLPAKYREVRPGPSYNTTEKMKEWIENEAWGHHASCTCPIGTDDDPMAVLDSKFRVRGVNNLRVVDASVFPKIPGYFIVVPVYMVGEKAADVIDGRG